MKNYYEILEISENASPEIIEKAYKTLAKKYHPDIQPIDKLYWAEIQMKEINQAYDVLSNQYSKEEYDAKMNFNKYATNYSQQYTNLYSENEYLKKQIENNLTNEPSIPQSKKSLTNSSLLSKFDFKSYFSMMRNTLYNSTQKPKNERQKDLLAIVLTIIIVSIIVLLFWKVPFLNKLISF